MGAYSQTAFFFFWIRGKSAFLRFPSASVGSSFGFEKIQQQTYCSIRKPILVCLVWRKISESEHRKDRVVAAVPQTCHQLSHWPPSSDFPPLLHLIGIIYSFLLGKHLLSDPVFNHLVVRFIIQVRVYYWENFLCFVIYKIFNIFFYLWLYSLLMYSPLFCVSSIILKWLERDRRWTRLPIYISNFAIEVFLDFHQTSFSISKCLYS